MNICRPITFYNNFVPPSTEVQEWKYETLGYYDGVDIDENIISFRDEFNLKILWENLEKKAEKLSGRYNAQTLYAFRTEDENTKISDRIFWKEGMQGEEIIYPFLFIMMVRLNLPANKVKTVREKIEDAEYDSGLKAITYLSLDNNDMIVVLKSKTYKAAAGFIDCFHKQYTRGNTQQKELIYDSFSVGGIRKEYINSLNISASDDSSVIERVCIRAIEREPGAVETMKKGLTGCFGEGKVDSYPVLGCEDEVFLLNNIPSDKFWKLYENREGMLSSSNEGVYQKSVYGMTTLILQKRDHSLHMGWMEDIHGEAQLKVKKMCEDLRNELLNIRMKDTIRGRMYFKATLQIINALQKYEYMEYADYTYIILYHPMKMLLKLIQEERKHQEEREDEQIENLQQISDFFYAINLLAQNSIRLERQFIQSVDLNARIYEAPVQLNAFYASYFSLLKDILNSGMKESDYEFMICPGMAEYLNVRRVLPNASRKNRLLLVEVPEHQIYDVRNQLMVMAHEAAHFVGRDIRHRTERHKMMLKVIVNSVSTFLVLDEGMHPFCTEESIKAFENEYGLELENATKAYYTEIEKDKFRIAEDRYHTEYMREDLWICAQAVLIENEDLLDRIGKAAFDRFGREMDLQNLDAVKKLQEFRRFKSEFWENKKAFLARITVPEITLSDECCINTIVDSNIHFMKEAFADSISVLLLRLSPEEYIESLLGSSEQIGKLQGHIRTIEWRIALVSKVVPDCCDEETKKLWEMGQLKRAAEESENGELKNIMKRVTGLLENYLSGVKSIFEIYEEDEERDGGERLFLERRAINRLYNREVSNVFIEYLKLCCKMFYDKEKYIYQKDISRLRDIWGKLKNIDNIEDYIINIRSFIEDYKKEKIFNG